MTPLKSDAEIRQYLAANPTIAMRYAGRNLDEKFTVNGIEYHVREMISSRMALEDTARGLRP